VGCVFRNEIGNILLADGFECIYNSVEEAEMRAAWETIRLMKERFAGSTFWLEGESSSDITKLQVWNTGPNFSILSEDARRMVSGLEIYKITYIIRERNMCAD